jgi:hypothetical protein
MKRILLFLEMENIRAGNQNISNNDSYSLAGSPTDMLEYIAPVKSNTKLA